MEGLLRTMRSNLMEKTGVNVNVKSLLAPWLVRHCLWRLTRFAIGADGHKQLSSINVAKTVLAKRHALAKPSVIESRFESKPKWNQGGKQTACSWESCNGIETTRPFRRMTGRSPVESRDSAHVCWSAVEPTWYDWRNSQTLVTSRELWCKHMEQQTDALSRR